MSALSSPDSLAMVRVDDEIAVHVDAIARSPVRNEPFNATK